MKTINQFLLIAWLSTGTAILAAEPAPGVPTNEPPSAPATTIRAGTDQAAPAPAPPSETVANPAAIPAAMDLAPDRATKAVAGTNAVTATNAVAAANPAPPPVVVENGTNGLRLNFRGAPLSLVLDYLSDAAGFIINKETDVRGTVEVWSKEPLTKDEAVEVLNSVLKKNGCAVIRNGRILTIVAQDTAKSRDLPVEVGSNSEEVEKSNEVVTQIIPVRYASVSQLVPNLELLLPSTATLTANESANSLILVATKTDIKRILKIISALDTSIASISTIKVIPLQYADAKETATLITQLFSSQAGSQSSSRGTLFGMFGGGGPFGGPPGFGDRDRGRSSSSSRSGSGAGAAAKNVVAVGDDRSNSVVISAPADLLATIETMVKEIDQEVSDVTELRVFRLVNADPTEIADQLAMLFPDPSTGTTGRSQTSSFPFFFRGSSSRDRSTTASDSDRAKKMGRVLAVADPRTSSIIVMASKTLMPQIAEMVAELDSDKGRKEVVGFYDLQNADPQDVQSALQDLFNRNTRMNNNNQNTMLGQNNPLTRRAQQNQQTTTGGTIGRSGGSTRGASGIGGGF
jgi:type II secretory pathway component GspD/PulD (secretin)